MRIRYWILLIAVLLLASVYLWKSGFFAAKAPFYIALSGPMSGKEKVNGTAMRQGVQMYLDKINQQGGINGHSIKLLSFDDKNQANLAKKAALQIAEKTQAVAVIGHYGSDASLAASPIYQQQGIPVISGSATADKLTQTNNWYFRTIFNNGDQAALLANYVRKILDYHYVDILFDEDIYGSTLADAFHDTADTIGLKVRNRWHFNNEQNLEKALKAMVTTLKQHPVDKSVVLLATHSSAAVKAIVELRSQGIGQNIKFVGMDALASGNFAKKMADQPREQAQPGYYSNGTYLTAPFLFDIAGQSAQQFKRQFMQLYQQEPTVTSALYYDAAQLIVHLLQQLNLTEKLTLKQQRQQIRKSLRQLSRLENAVEGVTGDLYFDKNGDAIKSIPIGFYKNGKIIAAEYQYQLLSSVQNNKHLLQDMLDRQIVQVNGKYLNRARVVYAGIDFNDISKLDFNNSVYATDFFIWFRFKGDFDDKNIEFINATTDIQLDKPMAQQSFLGGKVVALSLLNTINSNNISTAKPQTLNIKPSSQLVTELYHNGVTARSYRINNIFQANFDFHDYPLDQQILPISFRHKKLTRDNLIYVIDAQGMQLDQFYPDNIEKNTRSFFKLGGWAIRDIEFSQTSHKNDSTLGMPNLFEVKQRIEYSQFNVKITIKRHVINFILKSLLPVLFLIALGYFSFFIVDFNQKLALGMNLILATSLFHLKLSSDLANIGYIILMEYFFYLVYFLAIFVIIISLFFHFTQNKDDADSIRTRYRANLFGKIVYPLILIFGTTAIIYS